MVTFRGPCSWFGGRTDEGVDPDEGLAFFYEYDDAPHLFYDEQPPGTTGLARRLNSEEVFFVACRWDYDVTPKEMLRDPTKLARISAGGKWVMAHPADWGPHVDTGRYADVSLAVMAELNLDTDDEVLVEYPFGKETTMRIAISSGHGRHISGAIGIINEVEEARKVANALKERLEDLDTAVDVETFHDNVSDDQAENLNRIVAWHDNTAFGGQAHDWDLSMHFNAFEPTPNPRGTEIWYVTQKEMAANISAAIAAAGDLIDRGAKYSDDLFFLSNTDAKALLFEICFVDSEADVAAYERNFDAIIDAIASTLLGAPAVA
jgi:N-acetylmuramoyl-L-alanine amidase